MLKLKKRRRKRKKRNRPKLKRRRKQKPEMILRQLIKKQVMVTTKKKRNLIKLKLRKRMMRLLKNNLLKTIAKLCKRKKPFKERIKSIKNWHSLRKKEKRPLTKSEMRVFIIKIRNKPRVVRSILKLKLQDPPMPSLKKVPLLYKAKRNLRSNKRSSKLQGRSQVIKSARVVNSLN